MTSCEAIVNLKSHGDVDSFISSIVIDILKSTEEEVDRRFLETIDISLASEIIMSKIYKLVNLAIFTHDGQVGRGIDSVLELIDPVGEPAPLSVDPWARGIVSAKKIESLPLDSIIGHGHRPETPTSVSSRASMSSSGSSTARSGFLSRKLSLRTTPRKSVSGKSNDTTGKIISIDDELGVPENAVNNEFNQMMKKLRKTALGTNSSSQQPDPAQSEKSEKEKTNKKTGGLIELNKIVPNNIKTEKKQPEFTSIHKKTAVLSGSKQQLKQVNMNNLPTNHGAAQNNLNSSLKYQSVSFLPYDLKPISQDLQNLSVASSESSSVPAPLDNKGSPSKRRTSKAIRRESRQKRKAPPVYSGKPESKINLESESTILCSGDELDFNNSSVIMPESMPQRLHLDDLNILEGSRHIEAKPSENIDTDEESVLGPRETFGHVNLSVIPAKPTSQQLNVSRKMFSGGLRPKDRDFVANMKITSERVKLPPPPLGSTTGHGLGLGNRDSFESLKDKSGSRLFSINSVDFESRKLNEQNTNGVIKVRRGVEL